jgi:mono/diheme cytochrome c family protein
MPKPSTPIVSSRSFFSVAAIAAALVACAGKQTPRDQITDPGEMIYNGHVVADVACYKCHGGDGTGTWRGANLVERVPKLSDAALVKVIEEGPGMMPAFKGKLDQQQLSQLTAWLRGRFH